MILQPPHRLLPVEACRAALAEQREVGVVGPLPRLPGLVVDAGEDGPRAEDEASERPAVVVGMPLDPRRLDELEGRSELRRGEPAALPVGMHVDAREPRGREAHLLPDGLVVLVRQELLADPAQRLLAGTHGPTRVRVQEMGA